MVGSITIGASQELKSRIRSNLKNGFERIPRFVPAKWLLENEPEPTVDDNYYEDMNLESILFSVDFQNSSDYCAFLSTQYVMENEILEIEKATVGQMKNRKYCILKKFRLSASNFGVVLAAVRRNSYPPSLFKRLLGSKNLDKVS